MNRRKFLAGMALLPFVRLGGRMFGRAKEPKVCELCGGQEFPGGHDCRWFTPATPRVYWEGTNVLRSSPCPYLRLHPFDVYDLLSAAPGATVVERGTVPVNRGDYTTQDSVLLINGQHYVVRTTAVPPITKRII